MRRKVIRQIAAREVRDLLRDRRAVLLILGLPAMIYPAFVLVGIAFALTMLDQKTIIGVHGMENMPGPTARPEVVLAGGPLVAQANRLDSPALFVEGQFNRDYLRSERRADSLSVQPLASDDRRPLDAREVDAMIVIPADAGKDIESGKKPKIVILGREGDETSKLAVRRVMNVLEDYRSHVKEVRFVRQGLAADFDVPVALIDPSASKPIEARAADEFRDMLVKFLPCLVVLWTMAGALHPAIDLTAGERERGTLETLLVCPAGRSEIVTGKFFAVFAFSYGSALWNLAWIAGGAILTSIFLPVRILSYTGMIWAVVLTAPLAALFSALAVGLGAFARSTKEGQYYLLPLMLLALPLTLFALTPGLKLTPVIAAIPVAGLSMILQNLLSVSGEPISVWSWITGLGSLAAGVAVSLAWASWQFRRESVLFRTEGGGRFKRGKA